MLAGRMGERGAQKSGLGKAAGWFTNSLSPGVVLFGFGPFCQLVVGTRPRSWTLSKSALEIKKLLVADRTSERTS